MHEMLPLGPSVIEHCAFRPQSTLHESPQVPAQVDCDAHASVQLAPQLCSLKLQVLPALHAQLLPLQTGGVVETWPQAGATRMPSTRMDIKQCTRAFMIEEVPPAALDQATAPA